MASYGLGPARIVAAAVEQYADEYGIAWPRAIAPFGVELVALGRAGTPEREAADRLYETLLAGGVEVLYDDREIGPGEKFADAELLGAPLRLTVGRSRWSPAAPRSRSAGGGSRPRACRSTPSPRRSCGPSTSCGGAFRKATASRAG